MRRVFVLILLSCAVLTSYSQVNINAPWTWVSGEKHIPMRPVPGTKNVYAPENNPGGRRDAVSWLDQEGILWVFGGYGYGANKEGFFHDLWKYNQATNQWSWVKGSNDVNVLGKYGTQGVPDDANVPGGREGSNGWISDDGNFYLFGGQGYGATSKGMLNDLWKYNPQTNQWTWLSGSTVVNQIGIYGTKGISNSANWPGGRNSPTLWKGNDNKIWVFGGDGYGTMSTLGRLNDMWKYEPSTNLWTWVNGENTTNAPTTTTSPGARNTGKTCWKDSAGNLYLFGGASGIYAGASIYNPPAGIGGYVINSDLWKYNTSTNQWNRITQQGMVERPPGTYHSLAWSDNLGNFWMFGGAIGMEYVNYLYKYHIATNRWTKMRGNNLNSSDPLYNNGPAVYGIYGVQGIGSPINTIGGRASGISWTDAAGKLWSFGGQYEEPLIYTYRNDVWVYDPSLNIYTWMKGDSSATVKGIFGVKGVASSANRVGERRSAGGWYDTTGNLWLFGGDIQTVHDGPPGYNAKNDLWRYNINSDQWTWMRGANEQVRYGTQGIPHPNNGPGPRENMVTWTDDSNNLWLFGGVHWSRRFNDLWKYDLTTNLWIWVKGDSTTSYYFSNAVYGSKGVANPNNKPSTRQGAANWKDNAGNLWLFGGMANSDEINDLWKYELSSNQWTWISGDNVPNQSSVYGLLGIPAATNKPGARNGSATWKDNAGNLWLFGGTSSTPYYSSEGSAQVQILNDLWKYDVLANQWTWMHGDNLLNNRGVYGVKGIASVSNKPGARTGHLSWTDGNGSFWLMGGFGFDATGTYGLMNDLWMFNPLNNQWTWVKGDETINKLGYYGTKGLGSSLNNPGARYAATGFQDGAGNFWLYGGYGFGETGQERLADLWKLSSDISSPIVQFLEFKGRLVNDDGVLNWKTRNEGNVAAFVIERSTDRRYFYPVGTISANNSTGIQQYDFTDAGITSLGANIVYYRLKQTDRNGNVKYSNIVALTIDKSFFVFLYPNPVITTANVTITIDNPRMIQARIINAAGALVKQYQWNLTAGSTTLSLDLAILAGGTYYLDLSGDNISKRIPFIKQ